MLNLFFRRAAHRDRRCVQAAGVERLHSAVGAAVQRRPGKADAQHGAVRRVARLQPGLLKRHIFKRAIVKMCVGEGRLKERDILQKAAVKFAAVQAGPVKGRLSDPADGKGAGVKVGEIQIRMVGQAVERHVVKVRLTEKAGGKTAFRRPVINLLVDDFQRAFRLRVENLVLVRFVAAFGIGDVERNILFSSVLVRNASHGETY